MTVTQFKGLVTRFTSFTAQNLQNLLGRVNIDVIFKSIQDLGVSFQQIFIVAVCEIKIIHFMGY